MDEMLTADQSEWVARGADKDALKSIGATAQERRELLTRLIVLSGGRCRWTNLPLKFDKASAAGGPGEQRDPLYAEVDHRQAGSNEAGHDLVCAYVNEVKGQLPWELWLALSRTDAFNDWIARLQREWVETGTLQRVKSLEPTT